MDTLTPKKSSNNNSSSSSGCSTTSSTTDMKMPKKYQNEQKLSNSNSRSRSFLHCISKHLGRHFLHHHNGTMFNSQDDVRSSSTDSFSLSLERVSHLEACHHTGSSIDLTNDEHSSRTSSSSAYSRLSPAMCPLDNDDLDASYRHIYAQAMYRPASCGLENNDDELSSDNDSENAGDCLQHLREHDTHSTPATVATTPRSISSANSKGLHLSRISISSSVSRMLHHFGNQNSTRSLSCNNTPLRRVKDAKAAKKAASNAKKSTSSTVNSSASANASKKKEKKQQSILRPPIHYVYMKGMSGLYSRVPRYSVCCPYTMQQVA